jgi:phage regulator Rha-like protein
MPIPKSAIVVEALSHQIYVIRGQKVMLDADLAELYGVTTKRFNEQVKRNLDRFPSDFMFQLDDEEHAALRSQTATSNIGRGGRRYPPYVFTEHGAIMAATVLNSAKAIEMSVFVVRAFVQLREMLSTHKELAEKLDALERTVSTHDQAIAGLINAIRELMRAPDTKSRPIGFTADIDGGGQ